MKILKQIHKYSMLKTSGIDQNKNNRDIIDEIKMGYNK